jgi:hypothetical protein
MQANARDDLAGTALHDISVTEGEGGELAWLADRDPGVVVVDVSDERNPVAVAHFGAADDAFDADVDTGRPTRFFTPTADSRLCRSSRSRSSGSSPATSTTPT